jgi:hypothetical protein
MPFRIVFVYDPTNLAGTRIPSGKQRLVPNEHIWYTPCSGIWQTVWLESAPRQHVTRIDLDANMDGQGRRECSLFENLLISLQSTLPSTLLETPALNTKSKSSTVMVTL